MEAHTPKREAIENFVKSEAQHAQGWQIRVMDEQEEPVILIEASAPLGSADSASGSKHLEIHSRQVTLTGGQLDASTQKMITRWLESLTSGKAAVV